MAGPQGGDGREQGAPRTRPAGGATPAPDVTPTVSGAVADAGDDPVPVTVLVDGVLARHPPDGSRAEPYLRGWPSRAPVWPTTGPTQPGRAWLAEGRSLLRTDRLFGRVAVIAWCLLDDAVAAEAEASGLLGGLAAETSPRLADHLSSEGVELLRRRAPLVALQEGLLQPALDLPLEPGSPPRLLALDRAPAAGRSTGRWAVAFDDGVSAGRGADHRRVYPPSPGDPEPVPSATVAAPATAAALGWSRGGTLWIALDSGPGDGGVVQWDAVAGETRSIKQPWPPGPVAAVGDRGMALANGRGSGAVEVRWGDTDAAIPIPLPTLDDMPRSLAVSGTWTSAALADGSLLIHDGRDPTSPWVPVDVTVTDVAQVDDTCWFGTAEGEVGPFSPLGAAQERLIAVLPGEPVETVTAGGSIVVATTRTRIAVLRDGVLVARWGTDGAPVLAVSPDGDCLGLCTDGRLRLWRVDAEPELRLTAYLADTAAGEDLLGIGPTVDALAAVICAHVVQPPLSIGLFGSWGSGKTFFMEKLRERVAQVTDQARASGRAQSGLWAWRNVRQVRFNAWHYAAADVWAGMLEQLIAGLSLSGALRADDLTLPPGLSDLEKDRLRKLAHAEAVAADSERKLRQAERESGDKLSSMVLKDPFLSERFGDLVGEKAPPDLATTLTAVSQTRDSLRQVGWLSPGTRRQMLRAVGSGLAAALVILGVLFLLSRWLDPGAQGWGPVSAVLGAAAGVSTWASEKARQYKENLDAVTDAQRLLEEAREEVEKAREEARPATVGQLLRDYLEGRASSDDYRSQLGLIGTVHRDLRTISDGVRLHNARLLQPGEGADDIRDDAVNRVVLYIDDLDRCSPVTVVKVLEAVSMLLSFELFVVVVAVDAHWVSKALATVYPTLLRGGEVTADNYLEKIFQLPVWLDRPSPGAASAMALRLLDDGTAGASGGGGDEASGSTTRPTGAPATTDEAGTAYQAAAVPQPGGEGVFLATSPPASVALAEGEATAISALAPMLARSPRALKRYVNTYRLLKGLVEDDDLEAARLLLAVATGRPATGERLLDQIAAASPDTTLGTLVGQWEEDEQTWFRKDVPATLRTWSTWQVRALAPAADAVRRFVFRTTGADTAVE